MLAAAPSMVPPPKVGKGCRGWFTARIVAPKEMLLPNAGKHKAMQTSAGRRHDGGFPSEVAASFKAKKAVIMVGDWSNGDPVISRFLESQGRSGVPLYLWYAKGAGEPKVLPQILTELTIMETLGYTK